ncbi:hypothetical protein SAMN02745166_04657 [Prosthecobacter debontii]|uniref:Nucleotidyl transferase AbiEii toxin, Type IV TA system n=2 Tax=Prosthecobacter debontii TaxID=48467 RepID=A0A1T4YZK6_9BACT|nr:hypothetical protein SAMN02745166_04657 [Prosthecobacter debontii]
MGGQACVFYGAAQVSKNVDFVLLADESNYYRLRQALAELKAERIAIPRFNSEVLARGHAVHFRCQAPGVEGLRLDVMTKMREVDEFDRLWERRTTFGDDAGAEYHLLSVPDLVRAKKTQRSKDWPVIELLVAIHFRENRDFPTPQWIEFWLLESRTPELIIDLCDRFPNEARALATKRPLLAHAFVGEIDLMRAALDAEVRAEQARDRLYWEPLRQEMEVFRRQERDAGNASS